MKAVRMDALESLDRHLDLPRNHLERLNESCGASLVVPNDQLAIQNDHLRTRGQILREEKCKARKCAVRARAGETLVALSDGQNRALA